MITEDYVSFEVAKLLQNKGFDELCYACYEYFRSNVTMYSGWSFEYVGKPVHNTNDRVKCPTLQMALKWLREVHKYLIVIGNKNGNYLYLIKDLKANTDLGISNDEYICYEEAAEEAIKYCLTNLIK